MDPNVRSFIIWSVIFNSALVVLIWALIIRRIRKNNADDKEEHKKGIELKEPEEAKSDRAENDRKLLEHMEGLSEELNRIISESDPEEKKRFFVRPDVGTILFIFEESSEIGKNDVSAIAEVVVSDPRAIYCIFRYNKNYESIAGWGTEMNALKAVARMRVNLLSFVGTYRRAS